MIEGDFAGTTRDQEQKTGGPNSMGRPGARIDEDLDHRGHEQQPESRKSRRKPEHEQDGKKVFAECRQISGGRRIDDRQLVLIRKQRDRARFEVKALDFGLARLPKHRSREAAGGESDDPIGNTIQRGECALDSVGRT